MKPCAKGKARYIASLVTCKSVYFVRFTALHVILILRTSEL